MLLDNEAFYNLIEAVSLPQNYVKKEFILYDIYIRPPILIGTTFYFHSIAKFSKFHLISGICGHIIIFQLRS